ncbi:MAG: polysaccharide deacetylase family protein [Bacilli bacterium]|nr:polysaccharide deacetylase family protein [Bacilli bacterium]
MKKVLTNKKVLFSFLVLVVILLIIGGYFFYENALRRQRLLKMEEIKSHYGNFVLVKEDTLLQQKNGEQYEVVGSVHKGSVLALKTTEILEETDTFFPVLGTDYYVFYEYLEPTNDQNILKPKDYYLALDKKFVMEKPNLYQDDLLRITLDSSQSFDILYGTEEYYRVFFGNDYFDVKKNEGTLVDGEKNLEEASFIPIVQFMKYEENCQANTCISKKKVEEVVRLWQENQKYSITESEYLSWLRGDLRLKPGAMLITKSCESDVLQASLQDFHFDIVNPTALTFVNNDTTTKKDTKKESVNRYVIHQNLTNENNQKIMSGQTIEKPKPVVTTSGKGLPSMDAKATSIAVLNYHFFYDASIGEVCREGNCLEIQKFREQLDYLKENHYKTLTMEEYRAWMYGEIELPARSVLLTIDDGAMGTGKHNGNKLIPILEEYQMHATLFLITGWWDINNYRSPYLDIESHTYDMHTEGLCKNQTRGAKMLCSTKEQVLDDLRKSLAVTGSNKAFCFPFYAYNDMAIASLKEVGFQLGFVGGYAKSNRNQDKYKITRYPIHSNTTLDQFKNMIH